MTQIEQLLAFVKATARHGFLHPMMTAAAHTGARRSELLRMQIDDVDFDEATITIHEKKRVKEEDSTRQVPLTALLALVVKDWIAAHPGGPHLFCLDAVVGRSRTRSLTTGHVSGKSRATTLRGRGAGVRRREGQAPRPLTRDEAHDHFRRTLEGSKWRVVKGWHVLRHSFVSLCAARGVDQRLIDVWVGHTTEEMRRRYRHLHPSLQRRAIASVFEGGDGE